MTLLLAKSKVIVEQDGRSGETRGREYMNYLEPRLARLASLARLAMPHCSIFPWFHHSTIPSFQDLMISDPRPLSLYLKP
jgi:hypothetical protein